MAGLHPFRALRPRSDQAPRVAAVPYDVVSAGEARSLAAGNPLSFLHVSRAEIDLADGIDPYSAAVYERAQQNFTRLRKDAFVLDDQPGVYVYRLRMGAHEQTGIAACYGLDEYDSGAIKKHERTRRDKEDDRTRHMMALGAQTGPVFLTYRASPEVDAIVARACGAEPLYDFEAADGVRHTMWQTSSGDRDRLVAAFGRVPALYIADGHHRAASAARARTELARLGAPVDPLGDGAGYSTMLAVAFPHDQVQVLAYNRIVKDLAGMTPDAFIDAVGARFEMAPGPAAPTHRGVISMYFGGRWQTLRARRAPDPGDAIGSLDVSVLQEQLLAPILRIADVRTDKRIDFVGGIRGPAALEAAVTHGDAAVAFSMFPVSVGELMAVSDADEIMPPKSTWFEPKLRDGLLVHVI
jgi:uncharacterized protein (DUF1015 family)